MMIAKTSFYHGRTKYEVGDTVDISKGEAADLEKAGMIGKADHADEKMAETVSNKMDKPAANKSK